MHRFYRREFDKRNASPGATARLRAPSISTGPVPASKSHVSTNLNETPLGALSSWAHRAPLSRRGSLPSGVVVAAPLQTSVATRSSAKTSTIKRKSPQAAGTLEELRSGSRVSVPPEQTETPLAPTVLTSNQTSAAPRRPRITNRPVATPIEHQPIRTFTTGFAPFVPSMATEVSKAKWDGPPIDTGAGVNPPEFEALALRQAVRKVTAQAPFPPPPRPKPAEYNPEAVSPPIAPTPIGVHPKQLPHPRRLPAPEPTCTTLSTQIEDANIETTNGTAVPLAAAALVSHQTDAAAPTMTPVAAPTMTPAAALTMTPKSEPSYVVTAAPVPAKLLSPSASASPESYLQRFTLGLVGPNWENQQDWHDDRRVVELVRARGASRKSSHLSQQRLAESLGPERTQAGGCSEAQVEPDQEVSPPKSSPPAYRGVAMPRYPSPPRGGPRLTAGRQDKMAVAKSVAKEFAEHPPRLRPVSYEADEPGYEVKSTATGTSLFERSSPRSTQMTQPEWLKELKARSTNTTFAHAHTSHRRGAACATRINQQASLLTTGQKEILRCWSTDDSRACGGLPLFRCCPGERKRGRTCCSRSTYRGAACAPVRACGAPQAP